jgi:hypothetical protein
VSELKLQFIMCTGVACALCSALRSRGAQYNVCGGEGGGGSCAALNRRVACVDKQRATEGGLHTQADINVGLTHRRVIMLEGHHEERIMLKFFFFHSFAKRCEIPSKLCVPNIPGTQQDIVRCRMLVNYVQQCT